MHYLRTPTLILFLILQPLFANAAEIRQQSELVIIKAKSDYSGNIPNLYFEPANIEIKVGDTVIWINDSEDFHNVTLNTEITTPLISSNLEKKGSSWFYKFEKTGLFEYYCAPHQIFKMRGKIKVTD